MTDENWWDQASEDYYADTGRGGGVGAASVGHANDPRAPRALKTSSPSAPPAIESKSMGGTSTLSLPSSHISAGSIDLSVAENNFDGVDPDPYESGDEDADGGERPEARGVDRWLGPNSDPTPETNRRQSIRMAPAKASSIDAVDHALDGAKIFQVQLDNLFEVMDELPQLAQNKLQEIKEALGVVVGCLEEELQSKDTRSDVEALLDLENVNWDFNNDEVNNFRARASRVAHEHFQYKGWNAPSFYSVYPVIPDRSRLMCSVSFPTESNLRQIKMAMKPEDTVKSFLASAMNEFARKQQKMQGTDVLGDMDEYLMKAKGFREFLDPRESTSHKMMDHEVIRQCIRNRLPIDLAVVERVEDWTPDIKDDENAQAYALKVDESIKVLSLHEHQDLAARFSVMKWNERAKMPFVPMSALAQYFRVQIMGVDNVDHSRLPRLSESHTVVFVQAFLFHGTQVLPNGVGSTPPALTSQCPRWRHWIDSGPSGIPIAYNTIPRESRIALLLYGDRERDPNEKIDPEKDKPVLLAYVVHQLVDVQGFLSSGSMTLSMWPVDLPKKKAEIEIQQKREKDYFFIFRASTRENRVIQKQATRIQVRFPTFVQPVVAPIVERLVEQKQSLITGAKTPTPSKSFKLFGGDDMAKKMTKIMAQTADLFYKLDNSEKELLRTKGPELCKDASMLPKYLLSVDWTSTASRQEAYRLLGEWAKFTNPTEQLGQALELLSADYADYRVREYAVNLLHDIPDDEIQLYLLQLAQCLKLEPYHDSPLARFLLSRALSNPYQIGHHFFWTLKAELHWQNPDFAERYGVILEEYLSHCGHFAAELRKQNNTVLRLQKVAEHIANLKNNLKQSKKQCMKVYVEQLKKLNVTFFGKMGGFNPPLNPKVEAVDLIIDRCRFMSSKKVPLLLLFNNADQEAAPLSVIFKSGDDLRQDILTLQLLRVMDKIWLAEGLDLAMKPYTCIATGINADGEGVGMIETVTEAETVADIQWQYGGEQASAAFNDTVIDQFLKDHNKGPELDLAIDRFKRSCAGYCVATYLLGIGDRHNDNYMCRKDGVFFHIDFGHFLGNWKYKMGVKRERTKFVFTPEMCYVMGGKNGKVFNEFKELCLQALMAARKYGRLLENLFALMVSAGMPELANQEDIEKYLSKQLMLNEKETVAKKEFTKELKDALGDRMRRIDNQFHLMKHKGV